MSNEKETGLTEESMRNAVMLTVGEKHEIMSLSCDKAAAAIYKTHREEVESLEKENDSLKQQLADLKNKNV